MDLCIACSKEQRVVPHCRQDSHQDQMRQCLQLLVRMPIRCVTCLQWILEAWRLPLLSSAVAAVFGLNLSRTASGLLVELLIAMFSSTVRSYDELLKFLDN